MRNDVVDNLRIDINRTKVQKAIYVALGDTRTRTIHFTIADNGSVYELNELIFAELRILKPDGSKNDQTMIRNGNELQYTLRTQDINVVGEAVCNIVLTFEDGAIITTPEFSIIVHSVSVSDVELKSENEYTAMTAVYADMLIKYGQAEEYKTSAQDSAQRALTSETNARLSEEEAQESATSAMNSKNSAAVSEAAAQGYKEDCATLYDDLSAQAAVLAETVEAAQEVVEEATGLIDATKEYAEQAQADAGRASTSATNAATSEENAKTYEEQTEAVARSIPADYSTLSSDVQVLKGSTVELTQAQYDALPSSKLTDNKNYYIKDAEEGSLTASDIGLEEISGMDADDVQEGIEELNRGITPQLYLSKAEYEALTDTQIATLMGIHENLEINVDSTYKAEDIRSYEYILAHFGELTNSDVANARSIKDLKDDIELTPRTLAEIKSIGQGLGVKDVPNASAMYEVCGSVDSRGDCDFLADLSAIGNITVQDLSKYKYVVVAYETANILINPVQISVSLFKSGKLLQHTSNFSDGTHSVRIQYVSNTVVNVPYKVGSLTYKLYGVK